MKIIIGGKVERRMLPALALHLKQLDLSISDVSEYVTLLNQSIEAKESFSLRFSADRFDSRIGIRLVDLQEFLKVLGLSFKSFFEDECYVYRTDMARTIGNEADDTVFDILQIKAEDDPIPGLALFNLIDYQSIDDLHARIALYEAKLPPLSLT